MFFLPFFQNLFFWSAAELNRWHWWALLGLFYLFLALAIVKMRVNFRAFWGWLWSVMALLPFAWVFQFGPSGRLLYLPGVGILLLVTFCCPMGRKAGVIGKVCIGLVVCWSFIGVISLFHRVRFWRNEVQLFSRMVAGIPDYAPGYYNLGTALLAKGDTNEALVLISGR